MKTMLLAAAILLTLGVNGFAERNIVINKVDQVMGRLFFGATIQVGTTTMHAPLAFSGIIKASSAEGYKISVSSSILLGAMRKEPYTKKESYNLLPASLKPMFKHLYQEAISVDLSQ